MSQSYSEDCTYGGITNGSRTTKETIMSQSMVHEPRDSRSIEESLALIQHHVKVGSKTTRMVHNSSVSHFQGLNESQMYGGVPPPPPSEQPAPIPAGCPSVAPYLAPPPGFSDSEHSLSDCDSLGSENSGGGNFQRFGFSRVSKPRSLAVPSLTDQLRKERMVTQVSQVLRLHHHSFLYHGPTGLPDNACTKVNERDFGGFASTCR